MLLPKRRNGVCAKPRECCATQSIRLAPFSPSHEEPVLKPPTPTVWGMVLRTCSLRDIPRPARLQHQPPPTKTPRARHTSSPGTHTSLAPERHARRLLIRCRSPAIHECRRAHPEPEPGQAGGTLTRSNIGCEKLAERGCGPQSGRSTKRGALTPPPLSLSPSLFLPVSARWGRTGSVGMAPAHACLRAYSPRHHGNPAVAMRAAAPLSFHRLSPPLPEQPQQTDEQVGGVHV